MLAMMIYSGAEDVENDHKRHQEFGDLADLFNAADDDHGRCHHQDEAGHRGWNMIGCLDRVGDGVGLDHVADAEGGDGGEDRENGAQPGLFQTS